MRAHRTNPHIKTTKLTARLPDHLVATQLWWCALDPAESERSLTFLVAFDIAKQCERSDDRAAFAGQIAGSMPNSIPCEKSPKPLAMGLGAWGHEHRPEDCFNP